MIDALGEEEMKKYGFNGFVQKPISKSKFETLMNSYKS
jgi:hypothetical protein